LRRNRVSAFGSIIKHNSHYRTLAATTVRAFRAGAPLSNVR
jgi:hypothetical protein